MLFPRNLCSIKFKDVLKDQTIKTALFLLKYITCLEIGLEYKPGKSYQKTKTLTMEYKKIEKKKTNYYLTNIYPRE